MGDHLENFLDAHDFSPNTCRAFRQDLAKFENWFVEANKESLKVERLTTRDIVDFKNFLRNERSQAVSTINRSLISIRRFLGWLVDQGELANNPASEVKELRKQDLAPNGLGRPQVRKLLRELELRQDIRANAIFHLMLFTGARVGDVVNLELTDVIITDRSGSVTFRHGKGNKQRSVPLPLPARRAIATYLKTRPPVRSQKVFIGERGPLTDRGIRALCDKYAVICGFKIHPHLLRHTMAHQFLENNPGDLVALAQLLGHANLNTTRRYVERNQEQLSLLAERVNY